MSYRIVDEPTPSGLAKLASNPIWPFFASVFAGAWLAWPWFIVNTLALRSSRRFGDVAIVLGGLTLNVALVLGLSALFAGKLIGEQAFAYLLLLPQAARMVVVYALYMRQERTYQLFEHFGGVGKNGLLLVIAGGLVRGKVLASVPGLWVLLLV